MNLARAYQVMEQFSLDGLVVAEPVNVYHLLGYWPQLGMTRMGAPPTTFALLTRDAQQLPGLVTSRFIYYYTYADGAFERDLQVFLYRDVGDSEPQNLRSAASAAKETIEFPDRQAAPLSAIERRRRAALDQVAASHAAFGDSGAALIRAMKDMGLWRGRVGFDHALIAAVCEHHDRPGELVPGDNILRWIRLVKSPLEIQLLRQAATANVAAVLALGAGIRAGASHAELRRAFAVEAAQRGNQALFLNVDRVSSELSEERIVDGQAFFIDGVSHYRHYHGDFARTVFVGEPSATARSAAQAVTHAWQTIRERLRPGLRYSDIAAMGSEAIRSGGYHFQVGFGPHSVGLMHTDEPGDDAGGFYRKLDLTLCENMVLSVDCPVMNTGFGGSAHIEDLMLITADGAVPLHPLADPVIVV